MFSLAKTSKEDLSELQYELHAAMEAEAIFSFASST